MMSELELPEHGSVQSPPAHLSPAWLSILFPVNLSSFIKTAATLLKYLG